MRRKLGAVCIVLGIALLLGAVGLALYNRQEDRSAGESAQSVMPELVEQIRENTRPFRRWRWSCPSSAPGTTSC